MVSEAWHGGALRHTGAIAGGVSEVGAFLFVDLGRKEIFRDLSFEDVNPLQFPPLSREAC